jgi:ATP-dependent helicase/nuclease subunit A
MSSFISPENAGALDVSSSCFLFASAGSGKTKVLVDRFVKLLVCGCLPHEIMCVTFTNAAVNEMDSRIAKILKDISLSEHAQVLAYLEYLGIKNIPPELIKRAKCLFTEWLGFSNKLNIVTIHSFCQSILEKYPREAGLYPNFAIMDQADISDCLEEAKKVFFKKVGQNDDESTKNLAEILSHYSFGDLLEKIFSMYAKFKRFLQKNQSIEEYCTKLYSFFNVKDIRDIDPTMKNLCLTKDGKIRKKIAIPGLGAEEIQSIAQIVSDNRTSMNKLLTVRKTKEFLKIASQILMECDYIKTKRNMLDFTDIIHKTSALLKNSDYSATIFAQINNSIKHIMIDEAQDMNVDQWTIISQIVENTFNSNQSKTIFIVGDYKQSIYSFQDANPAHLTNFHRYCSQLLPLSGKNLKTISLNTCYRCSNEVINLVNSFFPHVFKNYQNHIAATEKKGLVQFIHLANQNEAVANFVLDLINNENISPKNIMLLTRSRTENINAVIDILEENGVQIDGISKININDLAIIQELVAFGEVSINTNNNCAMFKILENQRIHDQPMNKQKLYDLFQNRSSFVFDQINNLELISTTAKAKTSSPFDFFYYVAQKHFKNISQQEYAHIKDFLNTTQTYCEKYGNSLEKFIKWLGTHKIEYKSQKIDSDHLKINTIHGSKGLESPIVILIDFSIEADKNKMTFVWQETDNLFGNVPEPDFLPFFIKPPEKDSFEEIREIVKSCYNHEKEELLRMLYVAVTRAKDRLYILGPFCKNGFFETMKDTYVHRSLSSK